MSNLYSLVDGTVGASMPTKNLLDIALRDPRVAGRISSSDLVFIRRLSGLVTLTCAGNAIAADIRNGMDPSKAFFINFAAEAGNFLATEGGIALVRSANPYFVLGGAVIATAGVTGSAGNIAKQGASYLWDNYKSDIVNLIARAEQPESGQRFPVTTQYMFGLGNSGINSDQVSDVLRSCGGNPSVIKTYSLSSDGTYTIQRGDALELIARKFNKDMYELASLNGIEIVTRPDGSKFAVMELGKVLVVNASTSLKIVTAYEYASIRAMYDDDSAVGSLVNVVTQGDYNDWKRDAAISAFNLFGQPAIPQLAPLSLVSPGVQASLDGIQSSMSDMGFTDSMQLSAMPSMGRTSSLSYDIAAAYTESMAWQNPLSDSDYAYPWAFDKDIDTYNANLITSMPADFESQMAASVNNFWNGLTFDTGIGTVQVGGGTTYGGSGGGTPYVGVNFGCPIGIDLGNDTMPLDQQGLSQVSMFNSTAFFDMDGDGYKERTGWVGPDDGILVIDLDGDGTIDQAQEISFKLWSPDATSDLDGLRLAFDSNSDGVFDAQDARFSEFRIWQDLNQNGISEAGELTTLAERGLVADLLLAA